MGTSQHKSVVRLWVWEREWRSEQKWDKEKLRELKYLDVAWGQGQHVAGWGHDEGILLLINQVHTIFS